MYCMINDDIYCISKILTKSTVYAPGIVADTISLLAPDCTTYHHFLCCMGQQPTVSMVLEAQKFISAGYAVYHHGKKVRWKYAGRKTRRALLQHASMQQRESGSTSTARRFAHTMPSQCSRIVGMEQVSFALGPMVLAATFLCRLAPCHGQQVDLPLGSLHTETSFPSTKPHWLLSSPQYCK